MRLTNGTGGESVADASKPLLQSVFEYYGTYIPHSGKYNCAFHSESQPSMSVDLEKGLYKCFACGAAGDSWTAIMDKEGIDFVSAAEFSAKHDFDSEPSAEREEESVFGRRKPGKQGNKKRSRWARPW